jgi:hypothetical protein
LEFGKADAELILLPSTYGRFIEFIKA